MLLKQLIPILVAHWMNMSIIRASQAVLQHYYTAFLQSLLDLWLAFLYLPYLCRRTPDEIGSIARKLAEERDDWVYLTVETQDGSIQERFMRTKPAPPG